MTIPPNVWTPFGWADPFINPVLTVVVGKPPHDSGLDISTNIGVLQLHNPCRLAFPIKVKDESGHEKYTINAELEIEVFAIGCGRVVRIYRLANEYKDDSRTMLRSIDSSDSLANNPAPILSQTATGAIVTGAVLGTIMLGPLGGLAIGGSLAGAFTAAAVTTNTQSNLPYYYIYLFIHFTIFYFCLQFSHFN